MNYRQWLDKEVAEADRQFDVYRELVKSFGTEEHRIGMNRWDARRVALYQARLEYIKSLT